MRPVPARRDVIESGLLHGAASARIGIAGYPDGHPRIGADELDRALAEKIAAAEAAGLAVEIVTQFCFDARAILDYVARLRASGFTIRCASGLPDRPALRRCCAMRAAAACAPRRRRWTRRTGLVRQMFALTVPDDLVRGLADAAPDECQRAFLFVRRTAGERALGAAPSPMAASAIEGDSRISGRTPKDEA